MPTDALPSPDVLRSNDASWDAFVRTSPTGSYLQLTGWATVKEANGWRARRIVVDAGAGPLGVQVLIRRIGPGPFAIGYAPRGPVGAADPDNLRLLTEHLRALGRRERLSHITMDPAWTSSTLVDALRADGWHPGDALQHERTRVVELTDTERMWTDVRPRTQRYVKSARKAGITIAREGIESMPEFHRILVATAERAGFIYRDARSYQRILETFGPDDAYLLMARAPGGAAVAGLLLVRCGDTVAEPSGGMDDEGATSRANYLLKWESMMHAAAAGAARYDMWGIAHGGIDQFKAGFGGHEARYPGAFDLQTLPLLRPGIRTVRRGWVSLARRRRGLVAHAPAEPAAGTGGPDDRPAAQGADT